MSLSMDPFVCYISIISRERRLNNCQPNAKYTCLKQFSDNKLGIFIVELPVFLGALSSRNQIKLGPINTKQ